MSAPILGIAVATAPRMAWYIPWARLAAVCWIQRIPDCRSRPSWRLGPVLSDASIVKIGHDLKLATVLLGRHGVELGGLEFDSMIGGYLIDPTRSAHTLEDTALEHLGYKAILEDDLTGKGPKAVPLSHERRQR